MKSVIATIIAAVGVFLAFWVYSIIVPYEDPETAQFIKLTSKEKISRELFDEISQSYGTQFSSVILSERSERGSAESFLGLVMFVVPSTIMSVVFYRLALKVAKKSEPVGAGQPM